MAANDDDEYEVPLRDQRYFGAGIKRKRIQFVPSSSADQQNTSLLKSPSSTAASRYRSIVFKQSDNTAQPSSKDDSATPNASHSPSVREDLSTEGSKSEGGSEGHNTASNTGVCDICHRIILPTESRAPHETSIAHQICLQHSHPPSHLDRERRGLAVLQRQGWDPDSRLGLGADGKGILHPVKANENKDRAGLGARLDLAKVKVKEKPVKLDAGRVRKLEKDRKLKGEKMRELFYGSEDLQKYLGPS